MEITAYHGEEGQMMLAQLRQLVAQPDPSTDNRAYKDFERTLEIFMQEEILGEVAA